MGTKISGLPAAPSADQATTIPVLASGANFKATQAQLVGGVANNFVRPQTFSSEGGRPYCLPALTATSRPRRPRTT